MLCIRSCSKFQCKMFSKVPEKHVHIIAIVLAR